MQKLDCLCRNQKIMSVLALLFTLAVLRFVDRSLLAAAVLLPFWFIIYRPRSRVEIIMFIVGAEFFLIQDYIC